MLNEKLVELINDKLDSAFSIVTNGKDGAHLVNSWNSYIKVSGDNLLIPVGRMKVTEENLKSDKRVLLSICNREMKGLMYTGTGFLVKGEGEMKSEGEEFEIIKKAYPWARAVLIVKVSSSAQTL